MVLLVGSGNLHAQQDTTTTVSEAVSDSLDNLAVQDTLRPWETNYQLDSTQRDSLQGARSTQFATANNPLNQVQISDDGLPSQLDYSAVDTSIYDLKNQTVHLYGDAKIKYEEFNLSAGYISFNWSSNEVIAQGVRDTSGRLVQVPVFKDKNQTFEAKKIRFNFKSRKGIVENVVTKQGADLFVLGTKAKISSVKEDTTTSNVVYSQDAIFTTCDHPEPHFGIRSQKQKVIPNKMVVVGPSNLELGGVTTPLWLPFGFYPISNAGSTGLIFPKDIENDGQLGFGIKGVGWYFPIGETLNLQLTADYYLRGTWGLNMQADYRKRYKYSGGLTINYSSLLQEDQFAMKFRTTPINIGWNHRQDAKAHPTRKFGGRVNINTNGFNQNLRNDVASVQNNQLNSSIDFTQTFRDKPWRFTAAFTHNQNYQTGSFKFTFPNLLFTTGNFKPFQSKGSKKKWYDNLTMSYRAETKSNFTTTDDSLFTKSTLQSANTGMRHSVTANFSTTILKYFNFNVNTAFTENLYLKTYERIFDPTIDTTGVFDVLNPGEDPVLVRIDTTGYGSVQDSIMNNFVAFHNLKPITAGLQFKVFSTMLFKKGNLRGLRNVITPNFGLSYTPGYGQFFKTVDTDTRDEFNNPQEYSILRNGIYDKPSSPDRNFSVTYGFRGNIEAKVYSRKDKATKNIKLVESYSLTGNYNFEADSLNFSTSAFRARTSFFKKAISVNFSSTLNFYEYDVEQNKRVNQLLWDKNRTLFEATNTNLGINGRTTVRQLIDIAQRNEKPGKGDEGTLEALLDNFSLNYNLNMKWDKPLGRDTFFISSNAVTINGRLDITDKWAVRVGQIGYNFVQDRITYPDFGFTRDLHCWQMAVNWYPNANAFTFTLGVKPGTLEFIKAPYKRSQFEGNRRF